MKNVIEGKDSKIQVELKKETMEDLNNEYCFMLIETYMNKAKDAGIITEQEYRVILKEASKIYPTIFADLL